MNKPDPIMTVDEVAEYLNLHPSTVRRLARDGEIPAFSKIPFRGKVGRQWRVKRAKHERDAQVVFPLGPPDESPFQFPVRSGSLIDHRTLTLHSNH